MSGVSAPWPQSLIVAELWFEIPTSWGTSWSLCDTVSASGNECMTLRGLDGWHLARRPGRPPSHCPLSLDRARLRRRGRHRPSNQPGSLRNRLCADAGIDPHVTPYELRHTAISLQADAGRTSWEIADWAGTSEAMISSRYRHQLRRVKASSG